MQKIHPEKSYKDLVSRRSIDRNQILQALDVVKKYIVKKGLILTGGMAIDMAMRKKGSKLYEDDSLPDYDFYSPNFQNDAYALGKTLCKMKLTNISIIKATHPTTMKVRVNFETVADITYIPKDIYENMPTMKNKDGIKFEHPHFKMVNQHRALSYPYGGMPRPVILQRFGKDMERYELLYDLYPIQKVELKEKMISVKFSKSLLREECLGGFPALYYWMSLRKRSQAGYSGKPFLEKGTVDPIFEGKSLSKSDPRSFVRTQKKEEGTQKSPKPAKIFHRKSGERREKNEKKGDDVEFSIPTSARIIIVSNDPEKTKGKIEKHYKKQKGTITSQNYNAFLDTAPAKISMTFTKMSDIDILDNRGKLIAAKNVGDFWVANPQFIMTQFLSKYILGDETKENRIKYAWGYLKCFELVKNSAMQYKSESKDDAGDKSEGILPTQKVFGKDEISVSDILADRRILISIGEMKGESQPEGPINEYPKIRDHCRIRDSVKKFEVGKSWVFEIDGSKRDTPLQNLLV